MTRWGAGQRDRDEQRDTRRGPHEHMGQQRLEPPDVEHGRRVAYPGPTIDVIIADLVPEIAGHRHGADEAGAQHGGRGHRARTRTHGREELERAQEQAMRYEVDEGQRLEADALHRVREAQRDVEAPEEDDPGAEAQQQPQAGEGREPARGDGRGAPEQPRADRVPHRLARVAGVVLGVLHIVDGEGKDGEQQVGREQEGDVERREPRREDRAQGDQRNRVAVKLLDATELDEAEERLRKLRKEVHVK
ncbi:hypothetical protein WME88_05555 [Sorangium sp. So ce216]